MPLTLQTLCVYCVLLYTGVSATPLDDYVNRPDPTYKYEILEAFEGPGYTLYNINMTSQTWKPGELCVITFSLVVRV